MIDVAQITKAPQSIDVLGQILRLDTHEQQGLLDAWRALNPSVFSGERLDAELPEQSAEAFLQEIKSLPVELRIDALKDATSGEGEHAPVLVAELERLVQQRTPLSVAQAVERLAYERPMFFVAGLIGVGVAAFQMLRAIWHFIH